MGKELTSMWEGVEDKVDSGQMAYLWPFYFLVSGVLDHQVIYKILLVDDFYHVHKSMHRKKIIGWYHSVSKIMYILCDLCCLAMYFTN
jgi:hypothetical protein